MKLALRVLNFLFWFFFFITIKVLSDDVHIGAGVLSPNEAALSAGLWALFFVILAVIFFRVWKSVDRKIAKRFEPSSNVLEDKIPSEMPKNTPSEIPPCVHSANVVSQQDRAPAIPKSADQRPPNMARPGQSDNGSENPIQPSNEGLWEEFENARTAIKFRKEARSEWDRMAVLPRQQQKQFLEELDKQPDADVMALADKIIAKYRRPFETNEINDAYEKIWGYGEKARDEFRKAVEVLGNNLDLDFVVSQLEFDPGYGNEIVEFQSAKEFLTNCGYEIAEVRDRDGSHLVAKKGSSVRHFYTDASLIENANIEYKAKYDLGKK
jgi:hypothetical protein